MKKTLILALAITLANLSRSYAVTVAGDFDNSVSLLTKNVGQQWVSYINDAGSNKVITCLVVNSNLVITANADEHLHIDVGVTFTIGGVLYTGIAKTNDPACPGSSGTTTWKVTGNIPTNYIGPLTDITNASLLVSNRIAVFGMGLKKGPPILMNSQPVNIPSITASNGTIVLSCIGGTVSAKFAVQFSTNLNSGVWTTLPGTYTVPGNRNVQVPVPCVGANRYFRTVITEQVVMGYYFGWWDGVLRYGMNTVSEVVGNCWIGYKFERNGDPEECSTSPGDSSGIVCAKIGNKWLPIAIHFTANNTESLSFDGSDNVWGGNMYDITGLYIWPYPSPFPPPIEGGVTPSTSYSTLLPVAWIKDLIKKKW